MLVPHTVNIEITRPITAPVTSDVGFTTSGNDTVESPG